MSLTTSVKRTAPRGQSHPEPDKRLHLSDHRRGILSIGWRRLMFNYLNVFRTDILPALRRPLCCGLRSEHILRYRARLDVHRRRLRNSRRGGRRRI